MLLAHKIALDPNRAQEIYFARAAGTARFAWNWALAEWQRQYAAKKIDPSLPAPASAGDAARSRTVMSAAEAVTDRAADVRSFSQTLAAGPSGSVAFLGGE